MQVQVGVGVEHGVRAVVVVVVEGVADVIMVIQGMALMRMVRVRMMIRMMKLRMV